MTFPNPNESEIPPKDVHKAIEESADFRLIDCREEEEFAHCRIESGELIPLSQFGELALTKLQNETRPIVIYCHHGMRSLQAAQFLRQKGLENVWSLNGGIERWSTEIDSSVPRY